MNNDRSSSHYESQLPLRGRIENCAVDRLINTDLPVIVYGAGNCAENLVAALQSYGKTPTAICVDNKWYRPGMTLRGITVKPFESVLETHTNILLAVAYGTAQPNWDLLRNFTAICEVVGNVGLAKSIPMDKAFFEQNQKHITDCWLQLADPCSKSSYADYINSRLFGHTADLPSSHTPYGLLCDPLLQIRPDETYCDCGAFVGDTIEAFLGMTHSYRKIYAWEPDPQNASGLQRFIKQRDLKDIKVIEKCVGGASGWLTFDATGTSVSSPNQNGNHLVSVDTIDVQCSDSTLIKIDIEGAELDALKGAEHTIRSFKPKLLIAAYHRREDCFCLQQLLTSYRSDYRFFFRWHRSAPDDVMLYAL